MNEILNKINQAKHVVVVAHKNPDADSFGSASAMYTYLLTQHKKVSFFCATKNINSKLHFLPWFDKVKNSFPVSADLAIAFDCGSVSRLGVEIPCDLINIDHHASNDLFGVLNLVNVKCISTTQVLFELFNEHDVKINQKMATALYAGLLDDSNGFMSDDVDGTVFAVSRALIECGADYKLCNKFIMKYLTLAALRLKASMLHSMQLIHDGRVAVFLVKQQQLQESGALGEECEYALEEALFLPTVEVSVMLKENEDFSLKGSIRCDGDFDALKVASLFHGGGHRSRAGFSFSAEYSLEDALEEVLKIITKEI